MKMPNESCRDMPSPEQSIERSRFGFEASAMRFHALLLAILCLQLTVASPSTDTATLSPSPIIAVQQGQLQGFVDAQGVANYLGIPYAKPPLGALRFAPPEPGQPWEGVRNASQVN